MKKLTQLATIAIASLAALPVLAQGTTSPGASGKTPAEQMKKHDSQGASEHTPGHKMQDAKPGTGTAPGASEYAPGHRGSTGSSTGTGGNN